MSEEQQNPEQETIEKIYEIIRWLQANGKSQDISAICIALNDLAIESMWFNEQVSSAHAQMNNAEEIYKAAMAKDVANADGPVAKSERQAEVTHGKLKQEYIDYRNLYHRLRGILERVDRVLDHQRQRVSLIKQIDLKNT